MSYLDKKNHSEHDVHIYLDTVVSKESDCLAAPARNDGAPPPPRPPAARDRRNNGKLSLRRYVPSATPPFRAAAVAGLLSGRPASRCRKERKKKTRRERRRTHRPTPDDGPPRLRTPRARRHVRRRLPDRVRRPLSSRDSTGRPHTRPSMSATAVFSRVGRSVRHVGTSARAARRRDGENTRTRHRGDVHWTARGRVSARRQRTVAAGGLVVRDSALDVECDFAIQHDLLQSED